MKRLIVFFILVQNCFSQEAKLFLPETFKSLPNVRDFCMNAEQNEAYFTIQGYAKEYSFIGFIKKNKNAWSAPKFISFSGVKGVKDLEPFLSHDGLKLFFSSNRTIVSGETKKDNDIWFVERKSKNSKWSIPKSLGPIINTSKNEFYPSIAKNGNLYFTGELEDSKGKEDIYVSELINGEYTKPISLAKEINSEKFEYNAYVAPDESYIIFTSYGREDDLGRGDLYISKKDKNGHWLPARHMGSKLNSKREELCPFVDNNNKMVYFTSVRTNTFKVLNQKNDLNNMLKKTKVVPNGLSRVYCMPLNKI